MTNEEIMVELVAEDGEPVGTMEKLAAHEAPGTLHRAFSLFAFDTADRLVLQRRAAVKYHSPLLLTNTVCGHPFPGEDPADAVRRRTHDELGADLEDLDQGGIVTYQRLDERTGLVEHEYNHVFLARILGDLNLNPDEVDEVVAVNAHDLGQRQGAEPFTAWFADVWAVIEPCLDRFAPGFIADAEAVNRGDRVPTR